MDAVLAGMLPTPEAERLDSTVASALRAARRSVMGDTLAAMRPTPSPKPSLVFDSPSAPSSAPLGARDISSIHSDGSVGGNTPGEDMVVLSEEEQREEALAAQIAAQAGDLLEEEENADSGDDDQPDHQLTYDWENSDDAAEEDGDATALSVAEGPLALRTGARARTEASAVAERRTEPPSVHFRRQVVPGSVMPSSSSSAVFSIHSSTKLRLFASGSAADGAAADSSGGRVGGPMRPWDGRETVTPDHGELLFYGLQVSEVLLIQRTLANLFG